MDGGLGDAVHVDQARTLVAMAREPRAQHLQFQRFAAEDHGAQRQRLRRHPDAARGIDQGTECGRRLIEYGHAFAHQQFVESGRRTADRIWHHDHATHRRSSRPRFPDRESNACEWKKVQNIAGIEAEPVLR